jgi:hypothetical protein
MLRVMFRRWGLAMAVVCLGCVSRDARAAVFAYDGHTYEIVNTAKTWDEAAADAAGRQMYGVAGNLVRIESAAENQELFNRLIAAIPSSEYVNTDAPDGGGGAYAWIGATDNASEGVWIWNDNDDQFWSGGKNGTPVGGRYRNWGTVNGIQNEPDNYGGIQNAAGISLNGWPKSDQHLGSAGQWNDVKMDNQLYYVVEYAAVPEPPSWSLLGVALFALAFILLWRFPEAIRNRHWQSQRHPAIS